MYETLTSLDEHCRYIGFKYFTLPSLIMFKNFYFEYGMKISYMTRIIISCCLLLSFSLTSVAQKKSSKRASINLSKSLSFDQVSDEELAKNYEEAAKEAIEKGELAIAEDYYSKAREIYIKKKNKDKIAELDREIAKLQEQQNEFSKAAVNYGSASMNSFGAQKKINSNDAERLRNSSDLQMQSQLLQSNIDLLSETSQSADRSFSNQQMAEVNLKLDNKDAAVKNFKEALKDTESSKEKVVISKNIADVLLSEEKINEDILEQNAPSENSFSKMKSVSTSTPSPTKVIEKGQPEVELHQITPSPRSTAEEDISNVLQTLLDAYQEAIDNHQTLDANKILIKITDIYTKQNQYNKALDLYQSFSIDLPALLASDSTLQDPQIFVLVNEKIKELEKNRAMNDLLMKRKNVINYTLIAVIFLVLIILIVTAKTLYTIRKKNKRIALQSLRREMNPHFIFNSLNSVNQFIAQNNELEANKYLSSYSSLMRTMMENSNNDFVPLSVELMHLKKYLELEYLRFNDKFEYAIQVDEDIDPENILVPNMLLQPHLENAIWHGLRYTEDKGLLQLSVKNKDNLVEIIVEDNGIGLEKSNMLKTSNQKKQKSRGINNTQERIKLLNSLYHTQITLSMKDKNHGESGVRVVLTFAKQYKQ